jgi:formylglycine-generating enzyme required for sulfatase activity
VERQIWRYKGVAPFLDAALDQRTFFGRPRESRSLLGLVEAERLVVLFAKSGIGKTSIINAALLGPLRDRGYFPVVARLNQASDDLFRGVIETVGVTAKQRGVDCTAVTTDEWRFFKDAEFWSDVDNEPLRPVLILDQFEELFTLHAVERRRAFAARLADLIRGRRAEHRESPPPDAPAGQTEPLPPDLKIVLSLREDFLAHLEELGIPGILQNRLRLGALTRAAARDAIHGPAGVTDGTYTTKPFAFEEPAITAIIDFLSRRRQGDVSVAGDEIEPSQLQLICQYVEEEVRRRQDANPAGNGRITVTESDLGGENRMRMILESFYERTVGSIKPRSEARKVRLLCERRLVSSSGRRLTEDEDEIRAQFGVSKERLQQLVDARLLRAEPRLGGIYYELSHDSLVGPILNARRKRANAKRRGAVVAALVTLTLLTTVFGVFLWLQRAERLRAERRAEEAVKRSAERATLIAELKSADNLTGVVNSVRQLVLAHGLQASDVLPLVDESRMVTLMASRNPAGCAASVKVLSAVPAELLSSRVLFGAALAAADDLAARCPESRAEAGVLTSTLRERFVSVHRELPPPPTWQADESLNPRIRMEGGTFLMGSPFTVGDEDEHPQRRVRMSTFYIQQHEVTNEEYRRFDSSRTFPDTHRRHPVVDVTWYDALAYAVWVGGYLPTEAQWEYTARGKAGREYPWGNDPPGHRTQYYPVLSETVPVAQHADAATPEGVHDLSGNISEWCWDWFARYKPGAVGDPRGPDAGQMRVVKGHSIYAPGVFSIAAAREGNYPNTPSANLGFRVVFSRP